MKRVSALLMMVGGLAYALAGFSQVVRVDKGHYCSMYDLSLQCPQQVTWTLRNTDIGHERRMPGWLFVQDVCSPLANGDHYDFTNSGYDRGHLCAAGDRSANLRKMHSTFALSNIAPMTPRLNRGEWKKTEMFCRAQALFHDSIEIIALPIFLDRDTAYIGKHKLAVPHAFIKAAWLKENDSLIGVWFYWNK